MLTIEQIRRKQEKLKRKWAKEAELEDEKEAQRVAKLEAELREQEEITTQKRLLTEQREDERLRQKHIQRKQKIADQKWDKQFDVLMTQIKNRRQKDDELEEIRNIIQNREPTLQELDWESWLAVPLNLRLAELDFERAMEMFKRDNLIVKRRRGTGGRRKSTRDVNYVLTFTGDTAAGARLDYVSTTFNPDSYDGEGTGLNRGFTVSYWVKPLETTGDVFFAFGKRSQSDGRFEFGIKNQNKIKVGIGAADKDNNDGSIGFEVGTWYNFVVTYGGDDHGTIGGDRQVRVYLNGTEILKTGASGGGMGTANWIPGKQNCAVGCDDPVNAASYLYFGGRSAYQDLDNPYNQGWACSLSEVAIYNTEIDEDGTFANEVYNGGTNYDHSDNSGLVGYWKFNEGKGNTVKDYGPYGKDGTLTSDADGGSGIPTWEKRPKGYGQ
jgi:hypothetical protein